MDVIKLRSFLWLRERLCMRTLKQYYISYHFGPHSAHDFRHLLYFFSVATCRVHCCLRNVWMYRCSWPAGKYRRLHLQDRFASSDATVHRLRVAFICKRHRSLRRFQNSLNKSLLLCAFSSFSAFKSAFEPDMTMCYARMHLNHCSLKLLKLTRFV